MSAPLLEARQVSVSYGGRRALRSADLRIDRGECVVVFGANGAGKTTLLRAIFGLVDLDGGDILYKGHSVVKVPTHTRIAAGLALVPEHRHVFANLSVAENLQLAQSAGRGVTDAQLNEVFEYFPLLRERREQRANLLSGGEQQMLVLARALLLKPELLVLDEPSIGLAPKLVAAVFAHVRRILAAGTTILIVEQNAGALDCANRLYVIQNGQLTGAGTPENYKDRSLLARHYLASSQIRQ